MGASDFRTSARGNTAREAFDNAVKEAQYDRGHSGYTGTIAEKGSFRMISVEPPPKQVKLTPTRRKAMQWLLSPTPEGRPSTRIINALKRDGLVSDLPKDMLRWQRHGRVHQLTQKGTIAMRPEAHFSYEVDRLMDADDSRIRDKWGPAGCVDVGNGTYIFFGRASC